MLVIYSNTFLHGVKTPGVPSGGNTLLFLYSQIRGGVFAIPFTETLILFIHRYDKFLHQSTGSFILVLELRTDAQMQRLIRF